MKPDYRPWNKQQRKEIEMAKNQEKRIDKLAANLPAKERGLAIIDAIRKYDLDTAKSLQAATPRKNYSQIDATVADLVGVVENFSLRFDRTFYMLMMTLFASLQSGQSDKDKTENLAHMFSELFGLVAGLDLFSEKIGLSAERLLSFSTVIDGEWIEHFRLEQNELSEEQAALSKELCSTFEKAWSLYAGHSPFTVAA